MIMHQAEIIRRFELGELIVNPRKKGDKFDLQPASYDLSSGRAVWKELKDGKGVIQEAIYNPAVQFGFQPTAQLQPGQMMWIITNEELNIPIDCCATVFSKNNLAMSGVFAFNAGHVDPGYRGPIVIRLISLRATPFTITLGSPIYTIIFEALDSNAIAKEPMRPRGAMTFDEALSKVRTHADVALSNALFDLYADKIESRLSDYKRDTLDKLRVEIDKEFIREEKLNTKLWKWTIAAVLSTLALGATLLGVVLNLAKLKDLFK